MTDSEAFEYAIRSSHNLSKYHQDRLVREVRQLLRQYGFQATYDAMNAQIRFRQCAARIYHKDFHNWLGWIYRSERAAEWFWIRQEIPRWNGQKCGRLLVVGEQGIGDEILWASCLPECIERAEHVTYACDARLVGMLSRSFPRASFIERKEHYAPGELEADCFIPGGDLLPLFRRQASDFPRNPYLVPAQRNDERILQFSGRTGVGWFGRTGAIDPLALGIDAPLSVQHTYTAEGVEAPAIDLKDDLDSVLELISGLERIVCVPSSIHHLAGAAGIRCDVIWPEVWGEDEEVGSMRINVGWGYPPGVLAWYPTVTVYTSIKDWRANSDYWIARHDRQAARS